MSEKQQEALSGVVASNILRARKAANISQHRLAELSGLSRSTIAQVENGRYNSMTLTTLEAISRAVGVAEIDLLRQTKAKKSAGRRAFEQSPWAAAMPPTEAELATLDRAMQAIWPQSVVDPETAAELLRVVRRGGP